MIDGSALRALREAKGWSTYKLAEEAGTTHATIGRWEAGKRGAEPGFGTVCRVAEALGVPPWEFMLDPERVKRQLKIWPGGRPNVGPKDAA